jgi:hypothetical protein
MRPLRGLPGKSAIDTLAATGILVVFLSSVFYFFASKDLEYVSSSSVVRDCISRFPQNYAGIEITIENLQTVLSHCYDVNYADRLLDDFSVRRLKLLRQDVADQVILWMVALITISGVMLAALQLIISYKLSSALKSSELPESTLDVDTKGRLVLKSSVTGLFILMISFGFFFLFVKDVYRIEVVDFNHRSPSIEPPKSISGPQLQNGQPFLPKDPSLGSTPSVSPRS